MVPCAHLGTSSELLLNKAGGGGCPSTPSRRHPGCSNEAAPGLPSSWRARGGCRLAGKGREGKSRGAGSGAGESRPPWPGRCTCLTFFWNPRQGCRQGWLGHAVGVGNLGCGLARGPSAVQRTVIDLVSPERRPYSLSRWWGGLAPRPRRPEQQHPLGTAFASDLAEGSPVECASPERPGHKSRGSRPRQLQGSALLFLKPPPPRLALPSPSPVRCQASLLLA